MSIGTASQRVRPVETEPLPETLVGLLIERVRLVAHRRAAFLAELAATAAEVVPGLGDETLAQCLDPRDTPARQAAHAMSCPASRAASVRLAAVDTALAGSAGQRLSAIAELFELSPAEIDLLGAAVAQAACPELGVIFAALHRDRARPHLTAALVARLFGHPPGGTYHAASPLAQWQLVEADDGTGALACAPVLVHWLEGHLVPDAVLAGATTAIEAWPALASWPVARAVAVVRETIDAGQPCRLVIGGAPGNGRRTFARAVLNELGVPCFAVDATAVPAESLPDVCVRAQRFALIAGAAPIWIDWDRAVRASSNRPPLPLDVAIVGADTPDGERGHRFDLPAPDAAERLAVWRAHGGSSDRDDIAHLLSTRPASCGDIAHLAARRPRDLDDAARILAAREPARSFAVRLPCPFGWDDLILPDALRRDLGDFAFEARERAAFWARPGVRRLFPRGTGLVALLAGPPGTGKTMAAQVIAADIGLDLVRVDLATVVSKYVGDTAKNLRAVFDEAGRGDTVLLFDEADALFARRTDVRDSLDRHANADTAYLLQLLEDYDGVALLATNRKGDIDPAFSRRMRYVFDFVLPDPAAREAIVRAVLHALAGEPSSELSAQLARFASEVEISGGQLKTACVAAVFAAQRCGERLAVSHLIRGVERELAKEGRSLGRQVRAHLLGGAARGRHA